MSAPTLTPDIQRRIAELRATRPYDGRRVTLRESRGSWKYTGLSGICTRLAADHRCMVVVVEHDPEGYWPIGMEILAELDHEAVPMFYDPGAADDSPHANDTDAVNRQKIAAVCAEVCASYEGSAEATGDLLPPACGTPEISLDLTAEPCGKSWDSADPSQKGPHQTSPLHWARITHDLLCALNHLGNSAQRLTRGSVSPLLLLEQPGLDLAVAAIAFTIQLAIETNDDREMNIQQLRALESKLIAGVKSA